MIQRNERLHTEEEKTKKKKSENIYNGIGMECNSMMVRCCVSKCVGVAETFPFTQIMFLIEIYVILDIGAECQEVDGF